MPAGAALFGNAASRSQSKNLVECKAGKMTVKGKMVHPDKRKGLLYVHQTDDSLMHFCWKDRQNGIVEDDLIIFPDDCEFKRVPQCTTGRVYVLIFKSSSRKFFFWLQEPKTDKDDENCRRINEVLNNPPAAGSQRSGGATPDGDLQNLINNMSQQQLMQLFGGQMGGLTSLLGTMGNRPSTAGLSSRASSTSVSTPTTTASISTSGTVTSANLSGPSLTSTASSEDKSRGNQQSPIQLSDLQTFLSGLNVPAPTEQQQQQQQQQSPQRSVDLASALNSNFLQRVLADPELVRELQPHLPSIGEQGNLQPSEQLRSTLSSPQFQQSLSMFSAALQSGQLGPIVQQFEVGAEAVNAANQGNMEEFVKALQKASLNSKPNNEEEDEDEENKQPGGDEKRKKLDDSKKKKKDDEDDEGMVLD